MEEGMKRRQFIKSAVSGSAMVLTGHALAQIAASSAAGQSRSADSRIEILLNEPIGKIAPEIYGHFAEHLGGVVYGGILRGEDLKGPHRGGIWQTAIDAAQRSKASLVRW